MFRYLAVLLCSGTLLAGSTVVKAQNADAANEGPRNEPQQLRFFQLHNVAQQNDANEILVALRNMLAPVDKLYLVNSTSMIVVLADSSELDRAATIIKSLDRPKPLYRLTYTLNESDAGKRVGVQHFSEIVVLGQRAVIKQGDKVPVITGSFDTDKNQQQTQFTYLDVGMSLDSTIDRLGDGLRLRSKIEQSSTTPGPQNGKLADEPIVRQTLLEGTAVILPGKPIILGGIDIVGSTRHVDIEVVAEPVA